MSLFLPIAPTCPVCETACSMELVMSVNADRRPQLRDGILDGTFQREICPNCGARFRPEPDFIYLDVARGQWIAVEPVDHLAHWDQLEDKARGAWDKAFGHHANAAAKSIGAQLSPRVTFGWPAVVEKLLCIEHGIDDVALELLKLSILRLGGSVPMDDSTELRLGRVTDDKLVLGWIEAKAEQPVELLELPRDAADHYTGSEWDALRAQLSEGLYVDMNRLIAEA